MPRTKELAGPNPSQQAKVIAFLSNPATFAPHLASVERHETHGAIVFLAGDRAYKLKRAVRYPYMDYSTPELRRSMCEAELNVNRRTAPDLYLGVQPVVPDASGALCFGTISEAPTAVDWVVVMRRFPQEALLGEMCQQGALTGPLISRVAEVIADFHKNAERRPGFGGAAGIQRIVDENAQLLRFFADRPFDPMQLDRFDRLVQQTYLAAAPLLEERRAAGFVRSCHGDLHLNNICVLGGTPVLFDAIEFSDDFSCIDVLYDLAFLLMDLEQNGRRDLANTLLNRYLEITTDYDGLAALPLFLACRAAIRAHVAAAVAELHANANELRTNAAALLQQAIQYLQPHPTALVVTAGYSGTGKSTLARTLAPEIGRAPGAIILRSDIIRKRLFGADDLARLPQGAYSADVTAKVYRTLAERARMLLAGGQSVIADAVYGLVSEREAITAIASRSGARFCPFWLEASTDVLEQRLGSRTSDVSDATIEILHLQLATLSRPTWPIINASGEPKSALIQARALLQSGEGPCTTAPDIGSTQTR